MNTIDMTPMATVEQGKIADRCFAARENCRVVRFYLDGWVAKSYRWPAPGRFLAIHRNGDVTEGRYDRKRAFGNGPAWRAMSERGGVLRLRPLPEDTR